MAWWDPVFPCVSPALISMNATNKSHLDNSHRIHENWVHLPSNFPSKKWSIHAQKPYHICTWIHGSVNGGCLIQVDRADPKSRAVGSSGGPDRYVNMSHRIHVWDIYLHLVDFYGKCRSICHTWILWVWIQPPSTMIVTFFFGKWLL